MIKEVLANAAMYIGLPLSTLWIWQEFKGYAHLLKYLQKLKYNYPGYLHHRRDGVSFSVFNTYPKYDVFE